MLLRKLLRKIIKILKLVNFTYLTLNKGPNIADLTTQYQKTIKPFIEKPFIPTEVDKLQEQQKKNYSNISMTNAILIGPKQESKGHEVLLFLLIIFSLKKNRNIFL